MQQQQPAQQHREHRNPRPENSNAVFVANSKPARLYLDIAIPLFKKNEIIEIHGVGSGLAIFASYVTFYNSCYKCNWCGTSFGTNQQVYTEK